MLKVKHGDILKQDAEALINPVNCVGIMGRGMALQFREAFPENYEAYRKACDAEEVCPGRMFVFDLNRHHNPRWIINFPTKRHWKDKSRLEDILAGLKDLQTVLRESGIRSLAVPALGCGLGGLDWEVVRPLIEQALQSLPELDAYLFEPASVTQKET